MRVWYWVNDRDCSSVRDLLKWNVWTLRAVTFSFPVSFVQWTPFLFGTLKLKQLNADWKLFTVLSVLCVMLLLNIGVVMDVDWGWQVMKSERYYVRAMI